MAHEEAMEMAKKIGAKRYFEVSAKENQGVIELFEEAVKLACKTPVKLQSKAERDSRAGCCCVII